MKVRLALGSTLASVLLIVTACGDDDDSTADEAQQLCADLEALDSTVNQVAGADVDPNSTTIGDVQSAVGTLESEVAAVQDAEADLADSVKSDLQSAFDAFQSSVQDLPADDTLAEAGASIQAAAAQFQQAWEGVKSELSCEPTTSTS